ncbi:MAG: LamG domain-containing protein [Candidatus Tritonobacter lacicola]|nr:LamG domain-containing protein [Candidatus Tritonobacter lacicola]
MNKPPVLIPFLVVLLFSFNLSQSYSQSPTNSPIPTVTATYTPTPTASDLVAQWHLDEISGGIAYDSSGNGHNGTLINEPDWGADGVLGTALSFDGSNQYVQVLDTGADFDFDSAFTLSLWAKATSLNPGSEWGDRNALMGKWEESDGDEWPAWNLFVKGGLKGNNKIRFTYGEDEGAVESTEPMEVGQWYHIMVTWGGDGTRVKLYVNGVLENYSDPFTSAYHDSPYPVYIGCAAHDGTTNWHFDGIIDEVEVLNRELSVKEVMDKYKLLAARWRFDEGTGCVASDSFGHGNNGTLEPVCPDNCPEWTEEDTVSGTALKFDGQDDYVSVPDDDADFDFDSAFTLSLWAKADSLNPGSDWGDRNALMGKWEDSGQHDEWPAWNLFAKGGLKGNDKIRFTYGEDEGAVESTEPMEAGPEAPWYHIAVTWGGDGTPVTLYINAVWQDESAPFTTPYHDSPYPVYIGCAAHDGTTNWHFDGIIDEVEIFSRELNENEIKWKYWLHHNESVVMPAGNGAQIHNITMQGMMKGDIGVEDFVNSLAMREIKHIFLTTEEWSYFEDVIDVKARWPLDEGTDCTAHNTSGNGNHGTLMPDCSTTNCPEWTEEDTVSGAALKFDGQDDYVSVPDDDADFDFDSAFTLSLWAKANSLGDVGWGTASALMGKGRGDSEWPNWNLFAVHPWNEGIEFTFDEEYGMARSNEPMEVGQWYHIAVTWGGYGEKVKMYVNGALQVYSDVYPDAWHNYQVYSGSTDPVYIGCAAHNGTTDWHFDGIIDDVRIYDRELTRGEVAQIFYYYYDYNNYLFRDIIRLAHQVYPTPTPRMQVHAIVNNNYYGSEGVAFNQDLIDEAVQYNESCTDPLEKLDGITVVYEFADIPRNQDTLDQMLNLYQNLLVPPDIIFTAHSWIFHHWIPDLCRFEELINETHVDAIMPMMYELLYGVDCCHHQYEDGEPFLVSYSDYTRDLISRGMECMGPGGYYINHGSSWDDFYVVDKTSGKVVPNSGEHKKLYAMMDAITPEKGSAFYMDEEHPEEDIYGITALLDQVKELQWVRHYNEAGISIYRFDYNETGYLNHWIDIWETTAVGWRRQVEAATEGAIDAGLEDAFVGGIACMYESTFDGVSGRDEGFLEDDGVYPEPHVQIEELSFEGGIATICVTLSNDSLTETMVLGDDRSSGVFLKLGEGESFSSVEHGDFHSVQAYDASGNTMGDPVRAGTPIPTGAKIIELRQAFFLTDQSSASSDNIYISVPTSAPFDLRYRSWMTDKDSTYEAIRTPTPDIHSLKIGDLRDVNLTSIGWPPSEGTISWEFWVGEEEYLLGTFTLAEATPAYIPGSTGTPAPLKVRILPVPPASVPEDFGLALTCPDDSVINLHFPEVESGTVRELYAVVDGSTYDDPTLTQVAQQAWAPHYIARDPSPNPDYFPYNDPNMFLNYETHVLTIGGPTPTPTMVPTSSPTPTSPGGPPSPPTSTPTPLPTATPTPTVESTVTPTPTTVPPPPGMRVNFQGEIAEIPEGYSVDDGAPYGSRSNYGWR